MVKLMLREEMTLRMKVILNKIGEVLFQNVEKPLVLKSLERNGKTTSVKLKVSICQNIRLKTLFAENRPNRIPRDQWSGLVSYWLSLDKAKAHSKQIETIGPIKRCLSQCEIQSIATLMHEQ
ncbi:hypothetical protein H5410_056910 [Solanum commersonii]|uniref:Uncharacterized protein n=1 Tax=Solanum commersonii TaxID=4109 RepID=A0A9J5WP31_SOLCO|nr:hypothetical protein H5410_056910 [Solanum commersonii]